MSKYPISKEFYPYAAFTPPLQDPKMAGFLGQLLKAPGWLFRDKETQTTAYEIPGHLRGTMEVLVIRPRQTPGPLPAVLDFHGGGFFFGAAPYHYRLAKEYALKVPCQVVFVQYRLAPRHPFPTPPEDCYMALLWLLEHQRQLHIPEGAIGLLGDSAGGALAAAVAHMARDRLNLTLKCQVLIYPFTDRTLDSPSNRRFTDTPMWNSRLSRLMVDGYIPDPQAPNLAYAAPLEATSFDRLPPAYIETAEFDCLHDDGTRYGQKLQQAGIPVEQNETKGTPHGFDLVQKAPTTRAAVERRVEFLRRWLSL